MFILSLSITDIKKEFKSNKIVIKNLFPEYFVKNLIPLPTLTK